MSTPTKSLAALPIPRGPRMSTPTKSLAALPIPRGPRMSTPRNRSLRSRFRGDPA
jgi:hypothetical protein